MTTAPTTQTETIEMSRTVSVQKVAQSGSLEQRFEADEKERTALAARLGVLSIESFSGQVTIIYLKSEKSYAISGHIYAVVTQECRTTSKPVTQSIDDQFDETLVTEESDLPSGEDLADEEAVYEILQGEEIDYGEIATQWLSLALDPYPRAEGDLFEHIEHQPEQTNPFAALKTVIGQNNTKK